MKKYIFILVAFIACICFSAKSNAQDISTLTNQWGIVNLEGDELLETDAQEVYTLFTTKGDNFVHYTERPNMLVIMLNRGVFDFERLGRYSSTYSVELTIGYYDENGTLVDKDKTILLRLGERYSKGMIGSEKLLNYMRTQKGYVRFIAKRYADTSFDEKIPTWATNKPKEIELNL